jgi:prophage antirepressor-like protein
MTTKIAIFQKKEIRKTIHNNEWWFVIEDVVSALTDSVQPKGYIKDMRRRDPELTKGWGQIATPLSIETRGGKQKLNCANTEGVFRIIQSVIRVKSCFATFAMKKCTKTRLDPLFLIFIHPWGNP